MKDYRRLTEDEVLQLKSQSCLADDWGNVSVAEGFNCEYVHHTRFSGEVKLGVFESEFTLPGGIKKHSGLRHVTLHNVSVGDNCCIENHDMIANTTDSRSMFIGIIIRNGFHTVNQFGTMAVQRKYICLMRRQFVVHQHFTTSCFIQDSHFYPITESA